jgi:hydrogenase maturation protease
VKNTQRWTFGGIYPREWCNAQTGSDSSSMQTECLVHGSEQTRICILVRFLHLTDRTVVDGDSREVPFLQVGDRRYQAWQEAEEREIDLGEYHVTNHIATRTAFEFPASLMTESITDDAGQIAGKLIRRQRAIRGWVEVSAEHLAEDISKIKVLITNETSLAQTSNRDQALMHSLISTHTILGAESGEFVSMTDPPEELKTIASGCRNVGAWPALVGVEPERDTLLSSPIILYDYPQLAPESPGDLFDATEIDEILTLRILTLTDDEKRAAAAVDGRVRDLLARTESLARDQLMNLHGTIRGLHPVPQEQAHG